MVRLFRQKSSRALRKERPGLTYLMEAYFHQDWDMDGSSSNEVIQTFICNEPPEIVDAARQDLTNLLGRDMTEKELQNAIWDDFGAEFDPAGEDNSMQKWLGQAREVLSR